MNIPFVDLHKQYLSIKDEIDGAIASVIKDTAFIRGPYVKKFEQEYAADYGVKHCISVANGTDAIYIALKMLGIGPGDEVITTAHSWISTSETVVQAGAKPVFVDTDNYFTLDAGRIEEKITSRTKGIIPVHLYGQMADMDTIMNIAGKHGLFVIEDCAQAHYAEWSGRRAGTFGDAATFSFYPGKNLGAYGDAGAIITENDALAEKMRMYANHGALKKPHHKMNGINSRLDGMQAAILSAKLPYIHEWTRLRQERAKWYDELLAGIPGVIIPKVREEASHVYHLYVVMVENREKIAATLTERGIQTGIHYPVPLPLLQAYSNEGYSTEDFPTAAGRSNKILSLPMYPELTRNEVEQVASQLREAAENTDKDG